MLRYTKRIKYNDINKEVVTGVNNDTSFGLISLLGRKLFRPPSSWSNALELYRNESFKLIALTC